MRARVGAAIGVALFLISFAVYVRTLAPSITWANSGADGGDLATAAYLLGVAHPPGYPTYVLLGKLFSLIIPFGEIAYRVNLMSAFAAALVVVLVYLTVLETLPVVFGTERLEKTSLLAATIASLALAFSPVFWSQATIAEVYSLNAFFAAALCYLAVRWRRGGSRRLLLAAAFLLGLGAGNHLTLLSIVPGAFFLLVQRRMTIGWKDLAPSALFFVLGASVYVLLPLRAHEVPSLSWDDPTTLQGFVNVVFAAPYRRYILTLPVEYLPQRLSALSALLGQQFNWLGLAIGILGAATLWQRERLLAVFTLAFVLLTAAYAMLYNTVDSYVYLLPSFLVLALWLGVGTISLACQVQAWFKPRFALPSNGPVLALLILLLLVVPCLSLVGNFSTLDLSGDTAARDYAAEVFRLAEPDAIVIADTDAHITSLWYYRYVLRPDSGVAIVVQDLLPYDPYFLGLLRRDRSLVPPPGTDESIARLAGLIRANMERRPVYLTGPDPLILNSYTTREVGPLYRVERKR